MMDVLISAFWLEVSVLHEHLGQERFMTADDLGTKG